MSDTESMSGKVTPGTFRGIFATGVIALGHIAKALERIATVLEERGER